MHDITLHADALSGLLCHQPIKPLNDATSYASTCEDISVCNEQES